MLSYLMYFCYLSPIIMANSIDIYESYEYEIDISEEIEKYVDFELENIYNDFRDLGKDDYQIAKTDKVELRVYYETQCGGCKYLHTGPLNTTYTKIGSYIDLKLYPYGWAWRYEKNGKTFINCPHGPDECYGNKLHACAIDVLNNISRSEFYISCMFSAQWGGNGSTDMDATKCGELMGIDSKPIIKCAKSQRGEDLLEYYGRETDKVTDKKYMPWVLQNGKLIDQDLRLLMKRICEALTNPPPACEHPDVV